MNLELVISLTTPYTSSSVSTGAKSLTRFQSVLSHTQLAHLFHENPGVSVKAFLKKLNTDTCFMTVNRDVRSLTTGQEMMNNAWALDLNPR